MFGGKTPDLSKKVLGFRHWELGWVLDTEQPPAPLPPQFPPNPATYVAPPPSGYVAPPGYKLVPDRPDGAPVQVTIASWGPAPAEPRYFLVSGERVPALVGHGESYWHAGANRARCSVSNGPYSSRERHEAPGPKCGCGLYAMHDGERMVAGGLTSTYGKARVLGAVTAWGRLEVHADGFRAEYAQVVALAYDPAQGIAVEHHTRRTAEAFDVPCVPLDEFLEVASGFGEAIPAGMRGNSDVRSYTGESKAVAVGG